MRRQQHPCLFFAGAALITGALVWLFAPHGQQLGSVWVLLAKLVPFFLAVEAIVRVDVDLVRRLNLTLVVMALSFGVFLCYFAPRIFFLSSFGTFAQVYFLVITMLPFAVLAFVLCFRLGGAAASQCRRLAYGLLLLMLSGLEDLAFLTINHQVDPRFKSIPEHWTWASHINVFFGRPVTKYEAYGFITVHVVAAVLVLLVPARWLRPRRGLGAPRPTSSPSVAS
jgi:hypothetical protein